MGSMPYTGGVDPVAQTPTVAERQGTVPLVVDNAIHFKWLRTGSDAFSAMLSAINAATKSIRLETYIYCDDELGQEVRAALVEAAYRGVKVQVMMDGLGS